MKYNSIGEQLIAKAKELDPSYKPDKFNDMSEALDVILNNTGGGGIPVVEGTAAELTEEEQSIGATAKWSIPTAQSNNFIFHTGDDDDGWYLMSYLQGIYACNFIVPGTFNYILFGVGTFIYLIDNTASTNTATYCAIKDFDDGDHYDSSFVMPTGDVVVFTDESGRSLIGTKQMQDNVICYVCWEPSTVVESGQFKYKDFICKITKSNNGYNVERTDLSAVLQTNFEFLPDYSRNDNGKVLSVVNGEAKWSAPSGGIPSLPADASTSTYILEAVNGTLQWVKKA